MVMRENRPLVGVLLIAAIPLLSVLLAPGAQASDGRIPVYEATAITAPGSYYLTQNVTGSVDVQASEVTFDLNGHTVSADVNVSSGGGPLTRVRVMNGKVLGTVAVGASQDVSIDRVDAGTVTLTNASGFTVERVKAAHISLTTSKGGKIALCSVTGGQGIGLTTSIDNEIVGNTVTSNTSGSGWGISLYEGGGNFVHSNVVCGNGGWGIRNSSSFSNRIEDNLVRENGHGGILLNSSFSCLVRNNTATQNNLGAGVHLSGSSWIEISGNLVSYNADNSGMHITAGSNQNGLSRNTVLYNGSHADTGTAGILVEGETNVLDGNVATANKSYGISLTGIGANNNILTHNIATGNGPGGNYNIGGTGNVQVMYGAGYNTNQ